MSKTSGIIFISLVMAAFSMSALAENLQPPAGRGPAAMKKPKGDLGAPDRRLALMKESLSLTAEQLNSIRPVIIAEQAELDKLRGDNSLNRDQRREKLQTLNKATADQVRGFLDPEQQKKYDDIRNKVAENRAKSRSLRSGAVPNEFTPENRIARLTERLALTSEQQEKIMPILQAEYKELKTLPGNDSYNIEQRRAKVQQVTQETSAKIMPLLTNEQQLKYRESREKMIDRRSKKKRDMERDKP